MKSFPLFVILLCGCLQTAFSQEAPGNSPVFLSGYVFSGNKNEVGFVRTRSGAPIRKVSVLGRQRKAFKLNAAHQLFVRSRKARGNTPWMDAIVEVQTESDTFTDTFRIVRDRFVRNPVIAHRGAWKNTGVPENSLAALHHAVLLGCTGSEFDVHLSADSLIFVNHNPTVQGHVIAETPAATLSELRLANGETLPTLEAYLKKGLEQTGTRLVLELKASSKGKAMSIALARKAVQMVEDLHAQAWVDYISFDYDVCKEVMRLAPYAKVAYLMGDKTPAVLAQDGFYGLDYHFNVLQKNSSWITEAQQKGLTVNVWTVNAQAAMEDLLRQRVNFITTNEPELLFRLLQGAPEPSRAAR